jgi:hypothetical protein
MISHHLARVRKLLEAAATLPAAELERELRPGLVLVWFEGEETSAALMAERLVYTLEVWVRRSRGSPRPRRAATCCAASSVPRSLSHGSHAGFGTAAPGTTPSSTHSANRRSRSPTAASWPTC